MPKTITQALTKDLYTDQGGANINYAYQSKGGWCTMPAQVMAQIQHSSSPNEEQGQEQWSDEFVLPAGAHYLQPGIIGIRFRSFTPGNPVAVSAAIFYRDEEAIQLGGSGISSPNTGVAALNFQHNNIAVATESTADFEDEVSGTTFVWTIVDDPANTRVKITPVWQNPTIFPNSISTGPVNGTISGVTSGMFATHQGNVIFPNNTSLFFGNGTAFESLQINANLQIRFGSGAAATDTILGWNNPGALFLLQPPLGNPANLSGLFADYFFAGSVNNGSGTNPAYRATILAADTQPAWEVLCNGTIKWGPGGATALDTTLSRTSVGDLSLTTGSLFASANLVAAMGGDGGGFNAVGAAAGAALNSGGVVQASRTGGLGTVIFTATQPGDATNFRFTIDNTGRFAWGAPPAAQDVFLGRVVNSPTGTGSFLELTNGDGFGYGTGTGGVVATTNATPSTGTLSHPTGKITSGVNVPALSNQSYTITNTVVGVDDTIIINIINMGATSVDSHVGITQISAGSFSFVYVNNTGLAVTPVFTFAVIKGAVS